MTDEEVREDMRTATGAIRALVAGLVAHGDAHPMAVVLALAQAAGARLRTAQAGGEGGRPA